MKGRTALSGRIPPFGLDIDIGIRAADIEQGAALFDPIGQGDVYLLRQRLHAVVRDDEQADPLEIVGGINQLHGLGAHRDAVLDQRGGHAVEGFVRALAPVVPRNLPGKGIGKQIGHAGGASRHGVFLTRNVLHGIIDVHLLGAVFGRHIHKATIRPNEFPAVNLAVHQGRNQLVVIEKAPIRLVLTVGRVGHGVVEGKEIGVIVHGRVEIGAVAQIAVQEGIGHRLALIQIRVDDGVRPGLAGHHIDLAGGHHVMKAVGDTQVKLAVCHGAVGSDAEFGGGGIGLDVVGVGVDGVDVGGDIQPLRHKNGLR